VGPQRLASELFSACEDDATRNPVFGNRLTDFHSAR
jgi:hypothetical protein